MKATTIRRLHTLHRWIGVFVSANLLILCVTGLLLIFKHEIDELLGDLPEGNTPTGQVLSNKALLDAAQKQDPTRVPDFIGWDPKEHPGQIIAVLRKVGGTPEESKVITLNASTGEPIGAQDHSKTFTGIVLDLHVSLLLGPWGQLYIGLVGLAFTALVVLGFILYGPFMKKLAFGVLRRGRPAFTSVDLHKAVGIAIFAWSFVVALTGTLLALGIYLIQFFLNSELSALRTPPSNKPLPAPTVTIDIALQSAKDAMPRMDSSGFSMPGALLAGDDHFAVFFKGREGFQEKMLSIAYVHTKTGVVTPIELPWYLKLVVISQPLHFGDYGGTPLRIIWAIFTLLTTALTVTGLIVFFARRRSKASNGNGATALDEATAELSEEVAADAHPSPKEEIR
jgi:uncharacterized iron-regulated membrane protein